MSSCLLKCDFATIESTEYACRNWHYSKSVPVGKSVKIGVWENGLFKGVVVFSRGATPHIGKPYNLYMDEICELTRVALTKHQTPVTKIISISLKLLKKKSPKLRLVVSYADADQNHHGGIYQGGGWVYVGLQNANSRGAFIINGKKVHPRSVGAAGGVQSLAWIKKNWDPLAKEFITKGKHKYLMPLDQQMRKNVLCLSKPYPKRAGSKGIVASGFQSEEGGETPTPALQK